VRSETRGSSASTKTSAPASAQRSCTCSARTHTAGSAREDSAEFEIRKPRLETRNPKPTNLISASMCSGGSSPSRLVELALLLLHMLAHVPDKRKHVQQRQLGFSTCIIVYREYTVEKTKVSRYAALDVCVREQVEQGAREEQGCSMMVPDRQSFLNPLLYIVYWNSYAV
jgi:hypothetical protein